MVGFTKKRGREQSFKKESRKFLIAEALSQLGAGGGRTRKKAISLATESQGSMISTDVEKKAFEKIQHLS